MKNKYCPTSDDLHKEADTFDITCDVCQALNRQREDMEKEIERLIKSFSEQKSEFWSSEELVRIMQSLKRGDKTLSVSDEK